MEGQGSKALRGETESHGVSCMQKKGLYFQKQRVKRSGKGAIECSLKLPISVVRECARKNEVWRKQVSTNCISKVSRSEMALKRHIPLQHLDTLLLLCLSLGLADTYSSWYSVLGLTLGTNGQYEAPPLAVYPEFET